MKSTRRIGILLALVFLLPALFFSVYEISSFNKDEKMIQEIYNKQLEAILFSVNQYSDDLVNTWISRTETGMEEETQDTIPSKIENLLSYSSSLKLILICDTVEGTPIRKSFSLNDSVARQLHPKMERALAESQNQIRQLVAYKRSGFQKVATLDNYWHPSESLQCLVFVMEDDQSHLRLAALLLDPQLFIQDMVGPRLQAVARDQFILSVFNKGLMRPVYSTISSDEATLQAEALTKDFWLFPNFTLGIRTKGFTIQNLINDRTATNLFLLLSLDVVLIVAVVLVFRNVKREVQLAQNKADFVSNVSHEIRTPLALISMFAETLEMGRVKSEEKKQEYYGIISKETQRLSGIVNKILNFSQTEANKKVLNIELLHVSTEIKEILNTYDFHLTSKGFVYSLVDPTDLWIMADREAFIETIINLIDNAIKYSADTKRIEITAGREDEYGTVAVKDYGIGIARADQKHIFDKFYRVSSGNLAKSKGTGLGLSLVKQLMEAQQGYVEVYSEPGKGSLFTLYFKLPQNS